MLLSYALLFLIALAFIYPFILAIATSFKTLPEIATNPVSPIPQTFTLDGYQRMFALNVDRWAINSFLSPPSSPSRPCSLPLSPAMPFRASGFPAAGQSFSPSSAR